MISRQPLRVHVPNTFAVLVVQVSLQRVPATEHFAATTNELLSRKLERRSRRCVLGERATYGYAAADPLVCFECPSVGCDVTFKVRSTMVSLIVIAMRAKPAIATGE